MMDRTNALYLNGMTYSGLTVITLITSIVTGDKALFYTAGIFFAVTILSMLMSMLYFDRKEDLPLPGILLSFLLMLPLAMVVFSISMVFRFIRKVHLFIGKGGD